MYNKIIKDRDKSFWIKFPRYNALYSDEKLEVMFKYTYPNGTKADVKYSDREKIAIALGLYLMCSSSKTNFIYRPALAILEAEALLKGGQTSDSELKAYKHAIASAKYMIFCSCLQDKYQSPYDKDAFYYHIDTSELFPIEDNKFTVYYPFEIYSILCCNISLKDKLYLQELILFSSLNMIIQIMKNTLNMQKSFHIFHYNATLCRTF